MMPIGDFKGRMDGMIREIKSAPLAKGADRIYLPGEIELERRDAALVEGIDLPADVVASLRGLADDVGLDVVHFIQVVNGNEGITTMFHPLFDLTGRVALVTGAAQNMGRASAIALAEIGADLLIADINEQGLQDTAETIRSLGPAGRACASTTSGMRSRSGPCTSSWIGNSAGSTSS